MNKVELVRAAFDFPDPDDAQVFLADDFKSTDEVGGPPMDKATWIGMGEMLKTSFPDIDYVIEDIREEGAAVNVVGYFIGTFKNDLDLSPMGMGVISATGKEIKWPNSTLKVTIEGGKITNVHSTDTGPDAGSPGFFKALGVG